MFSKLKLKIQTWENPYNPFYSPSVAFIEKHRPAVIEFYKGLKEGIKNSQASLRR